jgi:uncharacterized membrane protein YozB (DUF420 family)
MRRGLLGTNATIVADINLVLQLIILALLIVSTLVGRRRGVSTRRTLMSIAVTLNAVLIIAVMNPSFFRILPFAVRNPAGPVPSLLWPHVLLGAPAELLGVYLVASANLDWDRTAQPGPVRRTARTLFRILLLFWTAALIIGLAVYSTLYR